MTYQDRRISVDEIRAVKYTRFAQTDLLSAFCPCRIRIVTFPESANECGAYQEFPARFVSCRVNGRIWTLAAIAI